MKCSKIKSVKRRLLGAAAALLCAAVLAACSSGLEGKLPGTYKRSGHNITFYSDGTYEEQMEYGTGQWVILDGHTLKLTDFYGSTATFELEDITDEGIHANGYLWERVR